jgi:hypothetical protein
MHHGSMNYCTLRLVAVISVLWFSPGAVLAQNDAFVPDFRHMKIENPATLSDAGAEAIYNQIQVELAKAFARSGLRIVNGYTAWKRYNRTPYLSSTHGDRYINNFANDLAINYDTLKKGAKMQAGAVIAKDGFAVTKHGEVLPGRLFIMEKLTTGTSPHTGDWRYVTIENDGSIIGDSANDPQNAMEFCHICHKVRASRDFLFYVPPGHRLP